MAGPGLGGDNAPQSYRCMRCGNIFAVEPGNKTICPVCGFNCGLGKCPRLEASDEGY